MDGQTVNNALLHYAY